MWISRKRLKSIEDRLNDLEEKQMQPFVPEMVKEMVFTNLKNKIDAHNTLYGENRKEK